MALFGRVARPERRGTPIDALVVGLGNPGREYEGSRHNVGFDALDAFIARHGGTLRAGRDRALVAEMRVGDARVVAAKPTTFMNDSGAAVGALARRFGIDDATRVVVVHDELDLEPGDVRVKCGGGLAGHNGLRSIERHLRTLDFVRVRIGVGKPPTKEQGAAHVLGRLGRRDREVLDAAAERAADAVDAIVAEGADAAMRRFNAR